ncbi:MAG: SAM-dependent methyltransferase [Planctomycetota bacterium]|jgi:SAM-dependent methyltransferase
MSRYEEIDWYDTPRYYDLIFDPGTQDEADFLEAVQAKYGKTRGKAVLEPACGSGRLVAEMARRGWKAAGFDLSPPMLEYARTRLAKSGLKARLKTARLEDFEYRNRFDLAHCLVSTFKYVLDAKGARSHLQCVANSLKPGGLYVLGFHLSNYGSESVERERWVESRAALKVICNTQTWPPERKLRRERVRNRLQITDRGRELRSETEWYFRTYDAAQVRRLFRQVPEFELVAVHDFLYEVDWTGKLDGKHDDCVFVLRRREADG